MSNFNRALMKQALALSGQGLVTNQLEYHPYLDQHPLVSATREAGLAITAYCGMAVGRVFSDPLLRAIARRHQRGVAQVVLRWLVQQEGVVALSRTTLLDRLTENAAVFEFELTQNEMAAIATLVRPGSRIVNPPDLAPVWD
ncbi:aldo/keto reductase [Cupriavidus lacunae]|uniref:aldo/keto reductase n=1 Tax=Cupriavidus lacunae TaxID=2666307 RepID=UPI001FC97871|nr:aldo/keto reductase [Cupriavidus lacunae]